MDLVHGSSTALQNRVQLREKLFYEKLVANMRNYESFISTTMRTLYVKELRILEKIIETHDAQGDLGNISKVNETRNFRATYDDRFEKQTNPIPSRDSHNAHNIIYANIRSRCMTRHFVHAKRLDREPSRILMKKLVHLMSKNKTKRRKIKMFIKQYIPKSSSWHNFLSTRFRKYVS